MKSVFSFLLLLFTAASFPAQTPTPVPTPAIDDLAGLWKAKRWFEPAAAGRVVIQRAGGNYTADMLGHTLPVRMDKGELVFDLPNGQGTFRGKLEEGQILGHWFRPRTPVNWSVQASPLLLKSDGPNRWHGELIRIQDEYTFFLLLQKRADGQFDAVLRNPEFDLGSQRSVDHLVRDGKIVKLMGKLRGQEAEIGVGTYDAENQVFTLNIPNRGGTYEFRRDGDDSEFYPRGKAPARYFYRPPTAFDDGWRTGTLDEVNIDRPGVERLIQKLIETPMDSTNAPQVHAVLIARHGKLVLEEYFHGENRDRLHITRSAAKSMTAIVVGAAMHAGAPLKLSSPVYQVMNGGNFPPGLDPQKRSMTLEHLLTMSPGFFCDDTNDQAPGNEETMINQTDEPDYYRFTLKVPQVTEPGENSVYCSAVPNLALGMVGRVTGELPIYSFDRLVGGPLKIRNYSWPLDPAGNPFGGGSVHFYPRDFLKFGQLMLNGGTWEGRRILSREFAAQATSRLYNLRKIYYGYLWWSEDYPYKNRTVAVFRATGAGGQSITVVPELDLVIAIYAGNFNSRVQGEVQHIPVRSILPAVREPGDDKNAPVAERDFKSSYGASKDGSRVRPKQ